MTTSNLPGFDTFLSGHAPPPVPNVPCPLTRAISPDIPVILTTAQSALNPVYGAPWQTLPGCFPTQDTSKISMEELPECGTMNQSPLPPRLTSPSKARVRPGSSCSVVFVDSYVTPLLATGSVNSPKPSVSDDKKPSASNLESLDAIFDEVVNSSEPLDITPAPPKPVRRKAKCKSIKKEPDYDSEANQEQSAAEQTSMDDDVRLVCFCAVCRLNLLGKDELLHHEVEHVRKAIKVMEQNCPVWLPPIRFLLLSPLGVICKHQQTAVCQGIDSFLEHFIEVQQDEKPRLDRYITRIKEMLPFFPNADPAWYAFRCMEADCDFESKIVVDVALHFLRIHNPFMPYCCLVCGQKSMIMGDMLMHMLHTHFSLSLLQDMGLWEDNPTSRVLKLVGKRMAPDNLVCGFTNQLIKSKNKRCMLCRNFTSSDLKALHSHINMHFLGEHYSKPYACLLCGELYAQDEDLKLHIFTSHLHDQNFLDAVSLSDKVLRLVFGPDSQLKTLVPEIGITDDVIDYNFWKLQEFTDVPHCACSLCSFVTINRVYKKLTEQSIASRREEEERVIDVDLLPDDADDCQLIEGEDPYAPLEKWPSDETQPTPLILKGSDVGSKAEVSLNEVSLGGKDLMQTDQPGSDVWQVLLESISPAMENKCSGFQMGEEIDESGKFSIDEVYVKTPVVLQGRYGDGLPEPESSGFPASDSNWAFQGVESLSQCSTLLPGQEVFNISDATVTEPDEIKPRFLTVNAKDFLSASQVLDKNGLSLPDKFAVTPDQSTKKKSKPRKSKRATVADLLKRIARGPGNVHQNDDVNSVIKKEYKSPVKAVEDLAGTAIENQEKGIVRKSIKIEPGDSAVRSEYALNQSAVQNFPNLFDRLKRKLNPDSYENKGLKFKIERTEESPQRNNSGSRLIRRQPATCTFSPMTCNSTPDLETSQIEVDNLAISPSFCFESLPANSTTLVCSNPRISPVSDVFPVSETDGSFSVRATSVPPPDSFNPTLLANSNHSQASETSPALNRLKSNTARTSKHSISKPQKSSKLGNGASRRKGSKSAGVKSGVKKPVQNLVQEYLAATRRRKRAGGALGPAASESEFEIFPKVFRKSRSALRYENKSEMGHMMLSRNQKRNKVISVKESSENLSNTPRDSELVQPIKIKHEPPVQFNDREVLLNLISILTKGNLNEERLMRYNLATPKFTAVFNEKACTLQCDCGCGLETGRGKERNRLLKHICLGSALYTCGFCSSIFRSEKSIQTHLVDSHSYPKANMMNGYYMYLEPVNNLVNQVMDFEANSAGSNLYCPKRSPPLTDNPMVVVFLQARDPTIKKVYCSRCGTQFVTLHSGCQHALQRNNQSSSVEVLVIMVTPTIYTVVPDPKLRMKPVVMIEKTNL